MKKRITFLLCLFGILFSCEKKEPEIIKPHEEQKPEEQKEENPPVSTLHKCSEKKIVDEMIFSSCCSRTLTSVQQGFDYDPVDNTLYFFQLNRLYRNLIGWTTPQVTLSTTVAPHYMGLSCFSHGNNIIFERTSSGQKYI